MAEKIVEGKAKPTNSVEPRAAAGASPQLKNQEDRALQVTRFEVIDEGGRILTRRPCEIDLSFQDGGRTLKVFVRGGHPGGASGSVAPQPQEEEPREPGSVFEDLVAGSVRELLAYCQKRDDETGHMQEWNWLHSHAGLVAAYFEHELPTLKAAAAEHQSCLDGDTAWAEKWKAKYEAVAADRSRLWAALQALPRYKMARTHDGDVDAYTEGYTDILHAIEYTEEFVRVSDLAALLPEGREEPPT